jgi:hypothetical protein
MKVDIKVLKNINNGRVKGKPKPGEQQIPKDDNLIFMRLWHVLLSGSLP